MRPKSILDPSFRYTSAVDTDVRKTFARVRKAQKEAADKRVAEQPDMSVVHANFEARRRGVKL